MAENKKSFLLYSDILSLVEKLPDDKAGLLFKHILRYVNDQNPTTDDLVVDLAFEPIKQSLKRDLAKYNSIIERNRENGLKGGRPKKDNEKTQETQSVILGSEKTQWVNLGFENNPKKADNDSDSDNDSVINNNTTRKPAVSVDWVLFLETFNRITGKSARVVNKKTQGQVMARLRDGYAKEDIVKAMQTAAADKFHQENGFKYLTMEYITRAEIMERYTTLKPAAAKRQPTNQGDRL